MAAQGLALNLHTGVRHPSAVFDYTIDIPQSLKVIRMSSLALASDVQVFQQLVLPRAEHGTVQDFVTSAVHYGRVLIMETWSQLKAYVSVTDYLNTYAEARRSADDALQMMRDSLRELEEKVYNLRPNVYWPRLREGGATVPTTGPYQLLHQALIDRLDISKLLGTTDDGIDLMSMLISP